MNLMAEHKQIAQPTEPNYRALPALILLHLCFMKLLLKILIHKWRSYFVGGCGPMENLFTVTNLMERYFFWPLGSNLASDCC